MDEGVASEISPSTDLVVENPANSMGKSGNCIIQNYLVLIVNNLILHVAYILLKPI